MFNQYLLLSVLCLSPIVCFNNVYARSLEEIKKSGVVKIGVRERTLVYNAKTKEFHHAIAETFVDWLSKNIKTNLKPEIVVAKSIDDLWKNKEGIVRSGESYSPPFFEEIDVQADVLNFTDWRAKLANPIVYLPTKYSFLCNFKEIKLSYEKMKTDKIKLITEKDSAYHSAVKSIIPENQIIFALVKDFSKTTKETKEKACNIINTDTALYEAKTSGLFFAGTAVGKPSVLAWWVSKNHKDTEEKIVEFWKFYKEQPEWLKTFKSTYNIEFKSYLSMLGDL